MSESKYRSMKELSVEKMRAAVAYLAARGIHPGQLVAFVRAEDLAEAAAERRVDMLQEPGEDDYDWTVWDELDSQMETLYEDARCEVDILEENERGAAELIYGPRPAAAEKGGAR